MISDDKREVKEKHLGKVLIPQNRKKVLIFIVASNFPDATYYSVKLETFPKENANPRVFLIDETSGSEHDIIVCTIKQPFSANKAVRRYT